MYKLFVTDAEYVLNDGCFDWKEGTGDDNKLVGRYETIQDCFDEMNEWGSRWIMYPSVQIHNDEGEEVWSSILYSSKCPTCGHDETEHIEGGLYTMRTKSGAKLFPEIV